MAPEIQQPITDRQEIECRGAAKTYTGRRGEPIVALEALDATIAAGEFVALVGPSGCGKSTLLNMMGGLLPATSGELFFRGDPILGPRPEVGMMFQAPVLFPWRTVLRNVLLPVDVRRQSRSQHEPKALELLDRVGLGGFASRFPSELSGGMQQRVALARLLLQDPDVLLLDEPFGALDEFTREEMNLLLLEIWSANRRSVVLVTHNINEAVLLADRVLVMTARPGCLAGDVLVDLPRPRSIETMHDPRFADRVFAVRHNLGAL